MDSMKMIKTVSVIFAAGLVAEGLIMTGRYAYANPEETFRIIEDSYIPPEAFSSYEREMLSYEEGTVFTVDTSDDLHRAFLQQSVELNEVFFLEISTSFDLNQAIRERDMGFVRCQWSFQHPVDSKGNRIDTGYTLHMFTVEYRDDVRVLQAYKNEALVEKLTANETAMLEKAKDIVNAVITPGMSELEKVLAIHDYIVLNGKYTLRSGDPVINASLHSAEGILMYGQGVCTSYTGSMNLLLGMVDIDSLFVSGVAQNKNGLSELHAWNKVMIDGLWYNIDATWDDPTPDKSGLVSYAFFGLTDEALSATHTWNRDAYPAAKSQYHNYFKINDLWASNYTQFKSIITREIEKQKGNRDITIRLYVENYNPNTYDLSMIFNLLTDVEKATHTKLSGTSGEFTLNIYRKKGAASLTPYLSSASLWARTDISEAYAKGFIPSDMQNAYQMTITRQEFSRLALNWLEYATGKSANTLLAEKGLTRNPNAFSDTTDSSVLAAYALGIINGTEKPTATNPGVFSPYGYLSGEEAAEILKNMYRLINVRGVSDPMGILTGIEDITFDPLKALTREQCIVLFNHIKIGG
jgi:hypothetical protein